MNILQKWQKHASPAQKRRLCELAGTTPGSLHQMAKAYKTGGALRITPDLARRLEQASRVVLAEALPGSPLPVLLRQELSPACGACEYPTMCAAQDRSK